ncbi:MAG: hypothetical protein H8E74_02050 [Gammaproteobacteria bacterium]|nr:hypothetical protein [Gammaproteobacteria bacterium]
MSKSNQHNKKPGIKDVVKVVSSIIQELQIAQERINELYGVIDMYIEYKKDDKKFKKYLDKKLEEIKNNDNNRNEPIDGEYTESDSGNEEVGTEGVRS